MKKLLILFWLTAFMLGAPLPLFASEELTVLFTHDMHSHLTATAADFNGTAQEVGGFAKLKTAIAAEREDHPNSILVDGGDFSMGTLYQTIYTTDSPELRLLGALGYDSVALGNHEFDFRTEGLTSMLHAAMESGDPLPDLLIANIDWEATLGDKTLAPAAENLLSAMSELDVRPYRIYNKNGVQVAVFGIFGQDSAACAPLSGLLFSDPMESARATVAEIKKSYPNAVILCLSHSGTAETMKDSEDQQLAVKVPDIDVIVSGHSHTTLTEPIKEGNTLIVSAGSYCQNLGSLTIAADGSNKLLSYQLIPLDNTVAADAEITAATAAYTQKIDETYLADFGLTAQEVVAKTTFAFSDVEDLYESDAEEPLGDLIADSFRHGAGAAGEAADIAVVPVGCVRDTFLPGEISVSQVFNAYSLGSGPDGKSGYPLVRIYLEGRELKNVCEVDVSVSSLMAEAKLHFSGLSFTYNPHRLFLDRVTEVKLVDAAGSFVPVEEDKLYSVVVDLYTAQMLGAVEELSWGLLSITPRDRQGTPIAEEDAENYIVTKADGREQKAWTALAGYMASFAPQNGIPTVPAVYQSPQGRKILEDNNSMQAKLSHPGTVFWLLCAAGAMAMALLLLLIFLGVRLARRYQKRKKKA